MRPARAHAPPPFYRGGAASYAAEGEGPTGDLRKFPIWNRQTLRLLPSPSGPAGHLPRKTGEAGEGCVRVDDASFGEEELLGTGIAGAAQGPVVAERRRHVAELGVGDDHALHHRREADGADLVEVLGPDPVELLRELDLLLRPDGARLVDDLDDALHLRWRLRTFLAAGRIPAPPQRAHGQDRGVARVGLGIAGIGKGASVL